MHFSMHYGLLAVLMPAPAALRAPAQAHAAALAAERNPLVKEMAIVTWLGHWQCNCGKVHKLWDACKCGQQPPCRWAGGRAGRGLFSARSGGRARGQ